MLDAVEVLSPGAWVVMILGAMLLGALLGALGGGGSALALPLFLFVAHTDPRVAIAGSLALVGVTSVLAATGYFKRKQVCLVPALLFGIPATLSAFGGGRLAGFVPSEWLIGGFATLLLGAAVMMWRRRRGGAIGQACPSWPTLQQGSLQVVVGLALGLVTGLVGAGGGFLLVPALVAIGGLTMPQAVGTSLVLISLNATAGLMGYLGTLTLPWLLIAAVTLVAAVTGKLTAPFAVRLPEQLLRRAFSVLAIGLALVLLWRVAWDAVA